MSYQTEFPNFVLDVEIPEGVTDQSWHNDACPRFEKDLPDGRHLRIWIDFANPCDRECLDCQRFAVDLHEADSTYLRTLIASDNWQDIVNFLNTPFDGD